MTRRGWRALLGACGHVRRRDGPPDPRTRAGDHALLHATPLRRLLGMPVLGRLLVAVVVLAALTQQAVAQDLGEVREQREGLEQDLQQVQRELEELEGAIAQREDELERLDARAAELTQLLADTRGALAIRARSAFKRGGTTTLEALVSSDGPTDGLERAATLDALARRGDARLESATSLRIQLEQTEALRADALADLERLREEMTVRIDGLSEDLERVRVLERDLELRAKRQRMIDRGMQQGIYSCPIGTPFSFIDSWGFPRSGGRAHKGVDIMAPYNTPVYAFTDGRISRMSSSRLGGISLYLWGDDGNEYFYAHLASYADSAYVGKRVEAGELIAYNGSTGNARGGAPHVHYEVHPGGGSAINPYPWVAAACY